MPTNLNRLNQIVDRQKAKSASSDEAAVVNGQKNNPPLNNAGPTPTTNGATTPTMANGAPTTTTTSVQPDSSLIITNARKETIRTSLEKVAAASNSVYVQMPGGVRQRVVFKNFIETGRISTTSDDSANGPTCKDSYTEPSSSNTNGVSASSTSGKNEQEIECCDLTEDLDVDINADGSSGDDQQLDIIDSSLIATTSTDDKNDRKRKHSNVLKDTKDQKRVCTDDKTHEKTIEDLKKYLETIANVKMNSCCDCKEKLKEITERNSTVVQKNQQFLKVVLHLKNQIDVLKNGIKSTKERVSIGTQCAILDAHDLQTVVSGSMVPPTRSNPFAAKPTVPASPIRLQPQVQPRRVQVIGTVHPQQQSQTPPRSQPPVRVQLVMLPTTNVAAASAAQTSRQIRNGPSSTVVRYATLPPGTVASHVGHMSGNTNQAVYIAGNVPSNNSPPRFVTMPPLVRAPNTNNAGKGGDHNLSMTSLSTSKTTQHPLPLPPTPAVAPWSSAAIGLSPPEPTLSAQKSSDPNNLGVQLSWNHSTSLNYAKIKHYQLFAYQENPNSTWKQVGTIEPLELPMACTLTAFAAGEKYHFAIRGVDVYDRLGPFSAPCSLKT